METFENNPHSSSSLMVSEEMKRFLVETSKWMKFLAVLGFVGLGLMLIASIIMLAVGTSFGNFGGKGAGAGMLGFIYLIMALLYFFPVLYLYRSSIGIKQGINANNQNQLNYGFENLKSHYKFAGILMIVILSMYILGIVVAILVFAVR